jgi:hypothetical protein
MADTENNNEVGMPAADVNFLIAYLQHANGDSISVSLLPNLHIAFPPQVKVHIPLFSVLSFPIEILLLHQLELFVSFLPFFVMLDYI